MIPRYSRPEMARVWSEEHEYDTWLRVEIAVCEAWGEQGVTLMSRSAATPTSQFTMAGGVKASYLRVLADLP